MSKKAVILFSGGLDSTTVLGVAKSQGYECYPISFNYAQRHAAELIAAQRLADYFQVKHKVFNLDIGQFGGSALTDSTIEVPDYVGDDEIPVTYVPARNTIFLSIALAYAEILGAQDIFLGVSSVDYSGYPDCRPEYIEAFSKMANLATKAAVEGQALQIHTPLIACSKAETIEMGLRCGVDYSLTVSCYQATEQGLACGTCDSCALRRKGFEQAGITDLTRYQ